MTFRDIFKSSFLENVGNFSPTDFLLAMSLSLIIGIFIFWIYKCTFKGILYSSSFAISLIIMTLITTLVILAITSNVVLSLGMVGALSIVRFRAAIKEPMDICFLFWAISEGIVIGAGLLLLAILGGIFIGIILFIFTQNKTIENAYILVLTYQNNINEDDIFKEIKEGTKKHIIKSKTITKNTIELTLEVRLKNITINQGQLINRLMLNPLVHNAILVNYNGNYMS